eukprot:1316268-Amorphochlora_amoeboformis.AAC.1
MELPETAKQKLDLLGSFIVLTEPRAGSEWFMSVLDENEAICASGTSTSAGSRIGFPRDIFLPYDKGTDYFKDNQFTLFLRHKMRMQCYWSFIDHWVPK